MLSGRTRWRTLALLGLVALMAGVALHKHHPTCSTRPPAGPNPANASFWVAAAVAYVPCPSTGRAIYGLHDGAHRAMVGLDPVADPRGGYLGVYVSAATGGPAGSPYAGPAPSTGAASELVLGRSSDLITWRAVRVLARSAGGARSPALEPVPGGGYLLAFQAGRRIELRFYPSLSALLAAGQATSIELPLRLSASQNGGPSFRSVHWNGGLRHSQLTIAFDYLTGGLERVGIGVVRGFRSWSARPDTVTDQQLDQRSLSGNHGQQRQFTVAGRSWRILEAQDLPASRANSSAGWHIALYDLARHQVYPLKLGTISGTLATSFGRPVARVLPASAGGGQDLVVSMYVFGSSSQAGELLYWTPIGAN